MYLINGWIETSIIEVLLEPNIPIVVFPGTDWAFQVLHESHICDKLKHQKRFLEVLFVLRVLESFGDKYT